jgi:RimJ/RimL family protein N-acetyltransferase
MVTEDGPSAREATPSPPREPLVGFCGFELGRRDGGVAELGFGYARSCWGRGIG